MARSSTRALAGPTVVRGQGRYVKRRTADAAFDRHSGRTFGEGGARPRSTQGRVLEDHVAADEREQHSGLTRLARVGREEVTIHDDEVCLLAGLDRPRLGVEMVRE